SDQLFATVRPPLTSGQNMHRAAHLVIAIAFAACLPRPAANTQAGAPKTGGATEAEWAAASDLAATLASADGGQRLAAAIRVREHGPVVHRHLTLAAAGCYHVGVAWVFPSDLEAKVAFDPGTSQAAANKDREITAPGGAI